MVGHLGGDFSARRTGRNAVLVLRSARLLKGRDTDIIVRLDRQHIIEPQSEWRFSARPSDLYLFDASGRAFRRQEFANSNLYAQIRRG